jgi:hypothetical protein
MLKIEAVDLALNSATQPMTVQEVTDAAAQTCGASVSKRHVQGIMNWELTKGTVRCDDTVSPYVYWR